MMHWLAHLLGWNGCDLVRIDHEAYCPGYCFIDRELKQCSWHAIVRCRKCGRVTKI